MAKSEKSWICIAPNGTHVYLSPSGTQSDLIVKHGEVINNEGLAKQYPNIFKAQQAPVKVVAPKVVEAPKEEVKVEAPKTEVREEDPKEEVKTKAKAKVTVKTSKKK